jgi:dienelactone hydrolase
MKTKILPKTFLSLIAGKKGRTMNPPIQLKKATPPCAPFLRLAIAVALTTALAPAALAKGVEPRFDLTDPAGAPFPSDRFTVPDETQLTGLRVNLPRPDCSIGPSDCEDVDVLNTLDGFNLQPRLSIPCTGPINAASVTSETVFLLKLGPDPRLIGINQVAWDPATTALHVESDEFLEQDTRYLLVVTDGVRDAVSDPIESAPFRKSLAFGQRMNPAEKTYRDSLLQALDTLEGAGVSTGRVAAASLFTTLSATAVMERIRDQVKAATPVPADFRIGSSGERTVFPLADVTSIALNRQVGTAPTFQTSLLRLSQLTIVPGTVGTIAFGRYASPDYEAPGEFIPPVGTHTGTPVVRSVNDVYFDLLVPSAGKPPHGWPVVIFGHGFNGNKSGSLRIAAKLAQHGLATLAFNAVGHGGGPLGTLGVNRRDGSVVTLPAGGRGIDQDGGGTIGTSEGFFAAPPQTIISVRDGLRQTVVDSMVLVRVIEVGMDVDGDGEPDLDPSRIYYIGGSGGGIYGAQFLALEPSVQTGVVNALGGAVVDAIRLGAARPLVGAAFGSRVPSLLNGGPDPLLPTNPFPFRENLPLRNQPPVVNNTAGAIAIQEQIERVEWAMQAGDPVAYASHLRTRPLAGLRAKTMLIQFAKGDKQIPNPSTTAFLRAGGLADLATYFRNDLAYAADPSLPKDPHEFWNNIFTVPSLTAIALEAEEQAATFLASDGQLIIDPDGAGPLFETPIAGPLPEELSFIP